MATKKKPTAKSLAALARTGAWQDALRGLSALSDQGDGAAAASTAELHAALGQWADFVTHAARFLADPSVVRAGNVFTDLTRVVRRAARELNDPLIIERLAATVPPRWHPMRDATLLRDQVPPSAQPGAPDVAGFEQALALANELPRFKKRPDELAAHAFALARAFKVEDELLARYDERWAWFDLAVDAARVLARRGDLPAAWALLSPKLPNWMPMDSAQVFPLVLLTDPWLSPLMTEENCLYVLGLRRGDVAR